MDLLFKRYASPFILLDRLIQTKSLNDYIVELYQIIEDEKLWDYFLHKVYDKSWGDFLDEIKPKPIKKINLGATIMKSKNILKNFTPESEV